VMSSTTAALSVSHWSYGYPTTAVAPPATPPVPVPPVAPPPPQMFVQPGCVTRLRKVSTDPEPELRDLEDCYPGTDVALGVDGKPNKCARKYNLALLHFKLPTLAPGTIAVDVVLSFNITQVKEDGIELVLYGLGQRGSSEKNLIAAQSGEDYYAGTDDPAPNAVLITAPLQVSLAQGATGLSTFSSPELTAYVASQLAEEGQGQYVALRLSGDSYRGCDESCDYDCLPGKYTISGADPTLSITASEESTD